MSCGVGSVRSRVQPPAKVGEFLVATVVAGFVDEFFGFGEVAFGEVVVSEVEAHAGAGSYAEDFFEIVRRGPGQELELSGAAEEFNGWVETDVVAVPRRGAVGGFRRYRDRGGGNGGDGPGTAPTTHTWSVGKPGTRGISSDRPLSFKEEGSHPHRKFSILTL